MKKAILLSAILFSILTFSQVGINQSQPNSTLVVDGSYEGAYKEISSNTTLTVSDQYINVTGTAALTLTLPNAITSSITDAFTGRVYHIKNTSSQSATLQGNGTQLFRTSNSTSSNTVVLRSGESLSVVKNTNFSVVTDPLWDIFNQSITTNNNTSFVVGETKSARIAVNGGAFNTLAGSRGLMTNKAITNTSNTNRPVAYELAGTSQSSFITIQGLRMDFMLSITGYPGSISPKLFNTTSSPVTYNVTSLSTNDAKTDGIATAIAPNHYSYFIDGNDDFGTSINNAAEYVNAMVTFPTGEWYNCTWHGSRDATNYYFYFTAQRLN